MENTGVLKRGEQIDEFKRIGLKVIQDKTRFCFGIDAVLLADFAKVRRGETVFDLGTGTGIIPLLLAKTTAGAHFTALELQAESAEMARRSVALNNLADRIDVVTGDIKNIRSLFAPQSCNVITVNPPYMPVQRAHAENSNPQDVSAPQNLPLPNDAKAIARHELFCTAEDVIAAAAWLLKPQGRLFMIHRPQRLAELCALLAKHKLEAKTLRMVQPAANAAPTMILLEARRNARPDLSVQAPLIVYKSKGEYSDEVNAIYERIK